MQITYSRPTTVSLPEAVYRFPKLHAGESLDRSQEVLMSLHRTAGEAYDAANAYAKRYPESTFCVGMAPRSASIDPPRPAITEVEASAIRAGLVLLREAFDEGTLDPRDEAAEHLVLDSGEDHIGRDEIDGLIRALDRGGRLRS